MVFRVTHTRGYDLDGNSELLFAPGQLVVRCPAVFCLWRENLHLRPLTHRRRPFAIQNCYWLILLAGDVEINPGPIRYPCTVCSKVVRSNQQGILCSRCEKWTHASCCDVSPTEYQRIGEHEDEPWYCPGCMMAELPFLEASITDCYTNVGNVSESVPDVLDSISLLDGCRKNMLVGHLNIRRVLPKYDELTLLLATLLLGICGNMMLGLSETWLDGTIADSKADIPSFKLF